MSYPEAEQIQNILAGATNIVIVQADNPDGDSMGSALALEQILGDMGKNPFLYCGVDVPAYLKHMEGWSRVSKELPLQFDASIIVDTSADSLLEELTKTAQKGRLGAKPCIVLDHHPVESTILFATIVCNKKAVATGEIIYELAQQLDWPLNHQAGEYIVASIMADSLGLTTDATSGRSIHIIAELVDKGISIAELEHQRRELMRKSPKLVHYKGELLQRIEYYAENRLALVTIPWKEIEQYSPEYNPSILVIDDMRMTTGVRVAIAFKVYPDGRITGKIRCNQGSPLAADLAKMFGGGGHPYASGFKIQDGRSMSEVKSSCIAAATSLLDKLERKNT